MDFVRETSCYVKQSHHWSFLCIMTIDSGETGILGYADTFDRSRRCRLISGHKKYYKTSNIEIKTLRASFLMCWELWSKFISINFTGCPEIISFLPDSVHPLKSAPVASLNLLWIFQVRSLSACASRVHAAENWPVQRRISHQVRFRRRFYSSSLWRMCLAIGISISLATRSVFRYLVLVPLSDLITTVHYALCIPIERVWKAAKALNYLFIVRLWMVNIFSITCKLPD